MSKDILDLHGYKSEDVEPAIDRFLLQLSKSNLSRARIMTGKGSGVVKNIAIRYLKQAGYPWNYEKMDNGKSNEGVLVLFLD
ncbi:MAG: Smr/MutS family protein [Pseudobdellovibrionaceae bacterium]